MLVAALISLGVVFVAELGDKSQLITMTYALRHRWWVVLTGVGTAAFLVHGLSVTLGHFLRLTLPERPMAAAAGIAFLGFAVWTWRERGAGVADLPSVREPRLVLFAVVSSFALAELGDKTMLATVALASDYNWAGVWTGATLGMVAADAAAVAVGTVLHRRLPIRLLHATAGLLFLVFGLWMLCEGALGRPAVAVIVTAVAAVAAVIAETVRFRLTRRPAAPMAAAGSGHRQQI